METDEQNPETQQINSIDELWQALRSGLIHVGFHPAAVDDICARSRGKLDYLDRPTPMDVHIYSVDQMLTILDQVKNIWSERLVATVQRLVHLEAELYAERYGMAPPPIARKARPEWLTVLEGGKV